MSNTDAAHGFRAIGPILRATWYDVDASNTPTICHNDFVTRETDGYMVRLSSENLIMGSVLAIENSSRIPIKTLPTLTAGRVLVADHPDQEYEAQVNGTWAKDGEGANYDITDTAGNATTGISNQEVDYSSLATTVKHVRVNKLLSQPGNAVGADANVVVTIVQHQRSQDTGV